MAKELIISTNGREKKIAIIENDKVTEFYIERGESNQGIVGNIYKGRVMRVLPGMQSAFVDIGLERDAFLYVSDFFDEEEEFERIVIDKTKKGESTDVEHAAAEQVAQSRVEREQRIEATQERMEPLLDADLTVEVPVTGAEAVSAESEQASRRRGRRGRRRGRTPDRYDETQGQSTQTRLETEDDTEDIDTPFGAADPSVQRIVDEEEAAVNGEMFKDARLQERILDQIHAREFNIEDDSRTAEVGSVLPVSFSTGSFQRVDDGDALAAQDIPQRLPRKPVAAHLDSFTDEALETLTADSSFQRVSDDDEGAIISGEETEGAADTADKKKRGPRKPAAARATKKKVAPAKKTTAARKSTKRPGNDATEDVPTLEAFGETSAAEELEDAEASISSATSVAEFATRRGGRRRRRPGSKSKPEGTSDTQSGEGQDQEQEVTATEEALVPEVVVPDPVSVAPPPERERSVERERTPERERQSERERTPERERPPERERAAERERPPERERAAERERPPERERAPERERPPSRDRRPATGQGQRNFPRRDRDRQQPTITDLLDEGQEILVQIAKEPIAKKGARITSHIALPGRFLVYMPTVEHVGVSRKIESDSERHRLRKIIQTLRAEEDIPSGGFIVRTAGVGVAEKELRQDVRYLVRTWLDIRKAAEKTRPATVVHQDLDLVQRILRDQLSEDFEAVRVDTEEEYQRIVEFVNRIQPNMVRRVKLYTRDQPILEAFGVQAEIDKAIKPRVWLKSGGYLVINQTEALVAIDVNTGKFVGRGSGRLEDTITRTNLEAVDEIVRQIRLRDLGGIIVLDLIDMEERRNRTRVMQVLQDALRYDKSPTKVLSFNDFGLVIMTRKRVKQSLERTLCSPCGYCQGAGLVKSPQTVCYEILEEARSLAKEVKGAKQTTLRINPEVARTLRDNERDVLTEIEDYLGPVDITSDPAVHQEQFDFAFV